MILNGFGPDIFKIGKKPQKLNDETKSIIEQTKKLLINDNFEEFKKQIDDINNNDKTEQLLSIIKDKIIDLFKNKWNENFAIKFVTAFCEVIRKDGYEELDEDNLNEILKTLWNCMDLRNESIINNYKKDIVHLLLEVVVYYKSVIIDNE